MNGGEKRLNGIKIKLSITETTELFVVFCSEQDKFSTTSEVLKLFGSSGPFNCKIYSKDPLSMDLNVHKNILSVYETHSALFY